MRKNLNKRFSCLLSSMLLMFVCMLQLQPVLAEAVAENPDTALVRLIEDASEPFTDIATADLDGLLERIGDSRIVLLGESTHGTAEFYEMRARITRELIENKGFTIVALEADWPDAVIIDQFIRDATRIPAQRYKPFTSFPEWMWGNHSFEAFTRWLKDYNQQVKTDGQLVSIYGLDFYNLRRSIDMVIDYLNYIDPEAADAARWHYSCMKIWARDPSLYSRYIANRYMASRDTAGRRMHSRHDNDCSAGVSAVSEILLKNKVAYSVIDKHAYFNAEQNARLVVNGERYFGSFHHEDNTAWNQRDTNMLESLNAILQHHPAEKVIIWAHNSHIGDARAMQMAYQAKHNLGQLVRETLDDSSYHIGFGSDHGTVAAAASWKGPMKIMRMPPSHEDSYEHLLHLARHDNFLLPLRQPDHAELTDRLMTKRMQRAIGVTYDPDDEIKRHYYFALLPYQFDEYIWFDETQAVKTLAR